MPSNEQKQRNDKINSPKSAKAATENLDMYAQQQRHPATLIQRAKLDPRLLTPRDVLQLQRTLGNEAVGRHLAQTAQHQPIQKEASPDLETASNRARRGGQPLEAGLQRSMGQADFSEAHEPTNGQSDQLNQSDQQEAFTRERDAFFRQGASQPDGREGQALIAHELTHAVQQNDGEVQRAPAEAVTPDQVTVTNNGTGVTADAIQVLKEIVAAIGETSATITSGRRTPAEQAAAMYTNLENTSVAAQKELYGSNGDKVIDVYVAGKAATPAKDATTIKQEMTDKINELGPSKVSRHCSENSVIDVAPSSITSDAQFQTKAEAHARVTKYLGPATTPSDPAHHLEIT